MHDVRLLEAQSCVRHRGLYRTNRWAYVSVCVGLCFCVRHVTHSRGVRHVLSLSRLRARSLSRSLALSLSLARALSLSLSLALPRALSQACTIITVDIPTPGKLLNAAVPDGGEIPEDIQGEVGEEAAIKAGEGVAEVVEEHEALVEEQP